MSQSTLRDFLIPGTNNEFDYLKIVELPRVDYSRISHELKEQVTDKGYEYNNLQNIRDETNRQKARLRYEERKLDICNSLKECRDLIHLKKALLKEILYYQHCIYQFHY